MKIAVVSNTPAADVLQRRGRRVLERYKTEHVEWIVEGLCSLGHDATRIEGDGHLIDRLRLFLGPALQTELPGLVLNLAYGVQGRSRYLHVPGLLEMLGFPYVGSGPQAHALASDKVVAKVLFRHAGLPTPDWIVAERADFELPAFGLPAIVKPRSETTSIGLGLAEDEAELREMVDEDLRELRQPILVERFVDGRELNVALVGNGPPRALPACEVVFEEGPRVYTREDKAHRSGRETRIECPAPIDADLAADAERLAVRAFEALGCEDWARVDLRLDEAGELTVLEVNSIPHLSPSSSVFRAAEADGRDLPALLRELLDAALARTIHSGGPAGEEATA